MCPSAWRWIMSCHLPVVMLLQRTVYPMVSWPAALAAYTVAFGSWVRTVWVLLLLRLLFWLLLRLRLASACALTSPAHRSGERGVSDPFWMAAEVDCNCCIHALQGLCARVAAFRCVEDVLLGGPVKISSCAKLPAKPLLDHPSSQASLPMDSP